MSDTAGFVVFIAMCSGLMLGGIAIGRWTQPEPKTEYKTIYEFREGYKYECKFAELNQIIVCNGTKQ